MSQTLEADGMVSVGIGWQDITPLVGTPLSGFIYRENRPSTSIDDSLLVKVLALRSEGQIYLLASYDLLGISERLEVAILGELERSLNKSPLNQGTLNQGPRGQAFSRACCVLTATHSHSGPPAVHLEGEAEFDPAYLQLVARATATAAATAIENLRPASLYLASTLMPGFTYNRRAVLADGRVSMAQEPDSAVIERNPVDDVLTLLAWRTPAGETLAGLVHFACHGVAVCTQAIGADIPGQVSQRMGRMLGAPCIFLQGATGDVNPTVVSGARQPMLEWVDRFMAEAGDLPGRLHPVSVQEITAVSATVPLEYTSLPPRGEVASRVKALEQIASGDVDSQEVQPSIPLLRNIMNIPPGEATEVSRVAFCARALAGSGRTTLAAIDAHRPLAPCPMHLALWRMGPVALAFTAAELFARTGFRIQAMRSGLIILPVTYTSPLVGYIPDRESAGKGGYEVDQGWQFYAHPAPFTPGAEQTVLNAFDHLFSPA